MGGLHNNLRRAHHRLPRPQARAALDTATHNVFWGLVAAAALCVVALTVAPRRFTAPA